MKVIISHVLIAGAFCFAFAATSRTDAANANAVFEGTWQTTSSEKEAGTTFVESTVMTIRKGHATQVLNYTATLGSSEDAWAFLPVEFAQVSPLRHTTRRDSTAINYRAGIMQITWGAPRLIDWSPTSIPRPYMEVAIRQEDVQAHTDTYEMRGDTLVESDVTWHRVSGQRATKQTAATSVSSQRTTKRTAVTSAGVGATRTGFAGTWQGITRTFPWGDISQTITIDSTETTATITTQKGFGRGTSSSTKLTRSGNTVTANFGARGIYSLTPSVDGSTMDVRLQAPFNDDTSPYHKTAGAPKAGR